MRIQLPSLPPFARLLGVVAALGVTAPLLAAAGPDAPGANLKAGENALPILLELEKRSSPSGDVRFLAVIEEKRQDSRLVRELLIQRRTEGQKFSVIVTAPKVLEGTGYLRVDQNLWLYDPKVGRWERRTERERLLGSNVRRSDLDTVMLSDTYNARFAGEEKVGKVKTWKVELTSKPGTDSEFPRVVIWVDRDYRIVKQQDYGASDKLMRTTYMDKYFHITESGGKGNVWCPQVVRLFDEVEKDRVTQVVYKKAERKGIPDDVFSKAWIESKSR